MQTVRRAVVAGLSAQLLLLTALAVTVGLGPAGWVLGVASGLVVNLGLLLARLRAGDELLPPADWVTLARATLVGGLAALVADSFDRPVPVSVMVGLSAVALALDAVDGRVARRTGTASAVGARFDMEVDAFAILVLSVYDVRLVGGWVLLIGAARYLFVGAGWLWPWLREPAPRRYWCKVVAAIQGIALTVVLTGLLPRRLAGLVLLIALALLAESFGRDVWWLIRHRPRVRSVVPQRRRIVAAAVTVGAFGLVWFALVAPDQPSQLSLSSLLRVPVEAIVAVAVVLVLPARPGRWLAVGFGTVLGVLTLVKVLDLGFYAALDRPFNPVSDWSYLGPAVGVLDDSIGRAGTVAVLLLASVVVLALLVLLPLATRRLGVRMVRRRPTSARFAAAAAVLWMVGVVVGLQVGPGSPVAAAEATELAVDHARGIRSSLADQPGFAAAIAHDPVGITPGGQLLTRLRGKDVVIAFVESYGRVAVQGSAFSPGVDAVLDAGTDRLAAAGFSARSGFLTSPTFGGISWLAHSTLESGLWVDSQLRYDQLIASNRFTLALAFHQAGWRTVADDAANYRDWPEGKRFYHYDQIYDAHNVGYRGPSFSYANMPDQYILSAFQRNELTPGHTPVMAEIDLVSSHTPWAPLPSMVSWSLVGDGTVFGPQPAAGDQPAAVWSSAARVGTAYGQSIQYSLTALVSWVAQVNDPNLVMVVLGDHQPATVVSGSGVSGTNPDHDVPVSIIAHDPGVLSRISGWGWQPGLHPSPSAPTSGMDTFRDRFLSAFGPST